MELAHSGPLRSAKLTTRCALLATLAAAICLAAWAVQLTVGAWGALDLTVRRGPGLVILYAVVAACIVFYIRIVLGYDPGVAAVAYFRQWRRGLKLFLAAYAVAACIGLAGYALMLATGYAHWSNAAWEAIDLRMCRRTLSVLAVVVVLATTEEVIFRGFVFNHLRASRQGFGAWSAVLVSAIIFAACHKFESPMAWLSWEQLPYFMGLFFLGGLLAASYAACGSLALPIGIHAGLLGLERAIAKTKVIELGSDGLIGPAGHVVTAPGFWILCGIGTWLVWRYRQALADEGALDEASG